MQLSIVVSLDKTYSVFFGTALAVVLPITITLDFLLITCVFKKQFRLDGEVKIKIDSSSTSISKISCEQSLS